LRRDAISGAYLPDLRRKRIGRQLREEPHQGFVRASEVWVYSEGVLLFKGGCQLVIMSLSS